MKLRILGVFAIGRGIILLLLLMTAVSAWAQSKLTIEDRTLGHCRIKIVVPKKWNHQVLMLAHGYRPDQGPMGAQLSTQFWKDGDTAWQSPKYA